jgi:hypothetical protein
MSQAPQFVISEFTNPSGEIVFRLTGWLDGKRICKNFKTRAEAGAERQSPPCAEFPNETDGIPFRAPAHHARTDAADLGRAVCVKVAR